MFENKFGGTKSKPAQSVAEPKPKQEQVEEALQPPAPNANIAEPMEVV